MHKLTWYCYQMKTSLSRLRGKTSYKLGHVKIILWAPNDWSMIGQYTSVQSDNGKDVRLYSLMETIILYAYKM